MKSLVANTSAFFHIKPRSYGAESKLSNFFGSETIPDPVYPDVLPTKAGEEQERRVKLIRRILAVKYVPVLNNLIEPRPVTVH